MRKIVSICCPKCNNSHLLYRYGKDKSGFQKYLCRNCKHQFAPDNPACREPVKYPPCPKCGKASFLHHDYMHYSNFRCGDKKCYHSFFVIKPTTIEPPSMSSLFGKSDFSGMRYPVQTIMTALCFFYLGKNSFRNIALIFRTVFNIKVSHTTISNWCTKFAPLFDNIRLALLPSLDFNSDEWHADETVVKVAGERYYLWFVVDSETRFILGFTLSPHRDSPQAFSVLNEVKSLGTPSAIVSDRYAAYKKPVESIFSAASHIRVESFHDDITNNLIESFHHQFKAWYKTKQGFKSEATANNLISLFVFFFNFVRPHSSLGNQTPAQVAGLKLSSAQKRKYLLVAS